MNLKNTADQAFVRDVNLSSVLRVIHTEAPLSRAQLAVITGLNKSTISSLVEELLARGLIHETGMNSTGTGRPSTLLEIDPQAGQIIGVELGVDFVSVALTDFLGKILWRRMVNANPNEDQETILAKTLDLVDEAIAASREMSLLLIGLGLAAPGIVDLDDGVLIFAPNLCWRNVPLRKIFSDHTHLKVFIENDANAAAIAEHLFGAARHSNDFIFVFAGVGIGSGLFLNGKLYRGKNGYAGEIGRSPIMAESSQVQNQVGNLGYWETYANQSSITQRVRARLELKQNSVNSIIVLEQNPLLPISTIKQVADAEDMDMRDSIAEAGTALGQGFASLINIFNPEKIILGGPLSVIGDYLLPSTKEAITRYSLPEIGQQVEVCLSTFGPDASLIGAISLVVDDILSNPTHVERRWSNREPVSVLKAL